ncbi:MAG TPA: DUF4912 domain-containing protein [Pirellulales bacterium]|nr:DUF4912 domain-containing protein [Pirellulales bacterium]
MTTESLNGYTMKDLAQMAKRRGVHGWHSMRKDQLVQALVRAAKSAAAKGKLKQKVAASRRSAVARTTPSRQANSAASVNVRHKATATNGASKTNGAAKTTHAAPSAAVPSVAAPPRKTKSPHALRRLEQAKAKLSHSKNLAGMTVNGKSHHVTKDRLVVMVRGPYWLHAYWELTRQGVERAEAALSQEWHAAKPVLRVLEVSGGATTSSAETLVRDIEIHGGVNNWYIDVNDPPKSYRIDIGYLAPSGKFFVLARSNVVTTPKAGSSDAIDENWSEVAEDFDKIYAMSGGYSPEGPSAELQELFEERLRRPMGSPMVTRYGAGVEGLLPKKRDFNFEVDAELIVYGVTDPGAHVTLQGEPVKLRPDGTFTVRFSMPNCRQVIPAVACSRDGFEQRTIVLAVERNTKTMEPLIRDGND